MIIRNKLLFWYRKHKRDLPWRETKDPYKVWLSEIILQQTRVQQGWDYYIKFINEYPTIKDLAEAEQSHVLNNWQGLGYYSRARNLHNAAQQVMEEFNGKFPNTFKDLKKLKGVGDYTASAISSICFNEPQAVVDGNVYRVLSRIFGISNAIDLPESKKVFKELAQEQMDKKDPGTYNQAIMDFGAIQCKPKGPECTVCPFQDTCYAFRKNAVSTLPVKQKKIKVKERFLIYYVIHDKTNILVHQRNKKDIWNGLFEFHLNEKNEMTTFDKIRNEVNEFITANNLKSPQIALSEWVQHKLTHQKLNIAFVNVQIHDCKELISKELKCVQITDLQNIGFPIVLWNYLVKNAFVIEGKE
ncbi:MAG: A/G-specific adenine glycosylase [Flavobacteriales bacterium]|nr:A/G-specific adenine glycosylase [Flavobacteriales bacterium]